MRNYWKNTFIVTSLKLTIIMSISKRHLFPNGSQTRRIEAPCGWITTGCLREANGKLKIHQKCCVKCASANVPQDFTGIASAL
jgi:hypothetical protein